MRVALNVIDSSVERSLMDRWNGLLASASNFYDCVLIDCHPAGSFFTKSALLASDAVVIPVTSDSYAATGLSMMRQHMTTWETSGGASDFLIIFNDAHHAWDPSVESEMRGDGRFAAHCLPGRVSHSSLLRNQAQRHRTAVEQRKPYRWRVASNIFSISQEMVTFLQEKSVFDSTWS